MPETPEATPLHKLPQIWKLAGATYGLVIAATILTVVAYKHYWPDANAQELELEARSARISVGDVWMPVYPGAVLQTMTSSTHDGVTDGEVRFTSTDSPAKLIAFYRSRLRGQFKVEYKKTPTGGTMDAVATHGKSTATLIFRASGSGCDAEVHAQAEHTSP